MQDILFNLSLMHFIGTTLGIVLGILAEKACRKKYNLKPILQKKKNHI